LQHLWKYQRKSNCPFKTYQELLHAVKFTSRTWNSKVEFVKILKHLTYCLNVDINLLGIKNTRNNSNTHRCEKAHSACYYTFYKFQNTFTKLKFYDESFFEPLIVLEYQKKFYMILDLSPIKPALISKIAAPSIAFEDHMIDHNTINDVLLNRPVSFSFSITVYSAFSYVKNIHSSLAKTLMICETPRQEKNLNLFLIPHIGSRLFDICILDVSTELLQPNVKDMYCNPHITEGNPLPLTKNSNNDNDLLNQDFCVCDHPQTKQFSPPPKNSFKTLGMFQFYYYKQTTVGFYINSLLGFI